MKFWLDAHLSPAIAKLLNEKYSAQATSIRSLKLSQCEDEEIFMKAREEDVIFITKDDDFIHLLERFGSPPRILWLKVGNTSYQQMKKVFANSFDSLVSLFEAGNDFIEVTSSEVQKTQLPM
jgi:predicted nuclease of predicted toxin-antitoxin system